MKFLDVCQPKLVRSPPAGAAWLHEPKLDGWRLEAVKDATLVDLYSRNGKALTRRLSPIVELVRAIPAERCILDGEAVAIGADGKPDFRALHSGARDLAYYVFDLLWLGNRDLRPLPLLERKRMLKRLLARRRSERLVLVEAFDDGAALLQACDAQGLEGVVSKLRTSPYRGGSRSEWVKTKTAQWREQNRHRGDLFAR